MKANAKFPYLPCRDDYFDPKRATNGKTVIIDDVHPYFLGEHDTILVVVEHLDGHEEELIELPANEKDDYEVWYNDALEAAHRFGFILAGEAEGK